MAVKTFKEIVYQEGKSTKSIIGTNIRGSKEVNSVIGNAIRQIKNQDINFLKTEIYLEDLDEDVEGYLFEKEKKQIFILWNKAKKRVSELIFSHTPDSFEEEDLVQAILLLEVVIDLTGEAFDFANDLAPLIHTEQIEKTSALASTFLSAIKALENVAQLENYNHKVASDDEFSINWSKKIELVENILVAKEAPATTTLPEEEKAEEINEETPEEIEKEALLVKAEPEKVEETIEVEQLSLLDDILKDSHEVKKPSKSSTPTGKKKKEVVIVKEVSVVTKEDVRSHSKLILEDDVVIKYCEDMGISPKLIKVIKKFRKNQVANELNFEQMLEIPSELKYRGWLEPLEQALVAFLTRNHLVLKGGAGSGKTTMMRTVGAILNMGVITATGSRDASIETFIGFKDVQDGNIIVHDGAATRAAKNGFIFVLEEGNAVMPSILIQLHNLFDDTRRFYNEFTGETVVAHPHHVFATCINEGYAGTDDLNEATIDRLLGIEMPYMKSEDLKYLLSNYDAGYTDFQKELLDMDDVSRKDIITLSEIAKALQQGVNDGILAPEIASIRNITDLFETTRIYPVERAIKMILNKYDVEDRRQMMEILDTVDVLEFNASDILKVS